MTCEHRDAVAAHVLGGLPPREALAIDQHLLTCDECARHRRELAMVRTLLDSVDREVVAAPAAPAPFADAPPELAAAVLARMQAGRPRRGRGRDVRLLLAGAAAALVLVAVPLAGYALLRDEAPTATTLALVGTGAAPAAWGEIRLLPRVDGTIVDVEAGDLPDPGARYRVTVLDGDVPVAVEEFVADTDGWGQALLATGDATPGRYSVVVERADGPAGQPVLRGGQV